MPSMFENRIAKRSRHLSRWAERWPTNAYRAYDWDIPEWPWLVDLYGRAADVQEFVRRNMTDAERDEQRAHVVDVVERVFDIPRAEIRVKQRVRQKGDDQYEKQDDDGERLQVFEGGNKFYVDLDQYLDTGLFLDHRETRRLVAKEVKHLQKKLGRQPRVLNLFAYTGTFSVWAASAGAHVTTCDLSNTYIDWAEDNFRLNDIDPAEHRFERTDVLRWLNQEYQRTENRWDIAILDPPTFSRSKKMERDMDIQRDHVDLINDTMRLLHPGRHCYFSTNFRNFDFKRGPVKADRIEEITYKTVPEDFREGIHRCWIIHSLTDDGDPRNHR